MGFALINPDLDVIARLETGRSSTPGLLGSNSGLWIARLAGNDSALCSYFFFLTGLGFSEVDTSCGSKPT